MKLKLIAAAVTAGLLCAAPTFASNVTVDFEGATSFSSINDFYNGGTDSNGASGVNLGISFGGDALALSNDAVTPYYSNAPTSGAVMSAVGSAAAMNVASGFTGDVSFWYSATENTSVTVFDGLNGTGSALATFTLLGNATNGCSDTAFCHWDFASLNLGSVAKSIQFGTAANVAGFDNVTVNAVPLPAAAWLMLSAIGGLGALRRKQNV